MKTELIEQLWKQAGDIEENLKDRLEVFASLVLIEAGKEFAKYNPHDLLTLEEVHSVLEQLSEI